MSSTVDGQRPAYPFSALVGQEEMKLALLLNAVNPRLGGVLIRGEKGTAKSTAVRALARLLPEIAVVSDCPYHCNPTELATLCEECSARHTRGEILPRALRPVPLVELPLGATEDRVAGTLDLERAIREGRRVFEPGLLARAHRGILYVDEVNLLQDHLVDVLLDAAAMGRNYVEREGISISHPAAFVLIGTMNPEEGDLRPQLLDRFALTVEVGGIADPRQRAEVVRRRVAFEQDPVVFCAQWAAGNDALREQIHRARANLALITLSDPLLELIARICTASAVDGLRADIALYRTATSLAAFEGQTNVSVEHIRRAAQLVLPHRHRRQPFEQAGLDREQLDEIIAQAQTENREEQEDPADSNGSSDTRSGGGAAPTQAPGTRAISSENVARAPLPSRPQQIPLAERLRSPLPAPGHHTYAEDAERGAHKGSEPAVQYSGPLDLCATLRAAAPFQRARQHLAGGCAWSGPVHLLPEDVRLRRIAGHSRLLLHFVLDASGSMGARHRMEVTKGALLSFLLDAYRKRDRVSLSLFRRDTCELVLTPTNSVDLAQRRIRNLPTGGRTPLAAALLATETLLRRCAATHRMTSQVVALVTDGRANVSTSGLHPSADALRAALRLRVTAQQQRAQIVVLDCSDQYSRLPFARQLAGTLGAALAPLDAFAVSRPDSIAAAPAP
ncbi:MAG: magnesium chelatase subunit D family protein [Chloroflexi bacterium]|nr:magnesium chelatase subunit D family protein [Chloroflexota bacterium]